MDIKHAFSVNPLCPIYKKAYANSKQSSCLDTNKFNQSAHQYPSSYASSKHYKSYNEGVYEIGYAGNGFSYDNEGPRHKVYIHPFSIASRLVTKGEYLRFIESNGYQHFHHWHSDGFKQIQLEDWKAPLYWRQVDGHWFEFTLQGLVPLQLNEPVSHLSYYEAHAYAHWAGARLPTEFEWEIAAQQEAYSEVAASTASPAERPPASDQDADGHRIESFDPNRSDFFCQLWQWTASPYTPYPGYRAEVGAIGEYNGKFMSGQMVLRGGSFATPRSHFRITYRNFFYPHQRWAFTGLRLAKDL